ncbi:hypothetical protein [Methylobacterium brachythecii]|uniref:Uncharacterized protein n=1 Tax=Methylobacterium brachythecii TaxID=1176177 RepID=A0A7W6F7N0_9HYPH|nr:hypothetical protein [Methylobacterium brachythecii]MBB3903558.1 hypothetical protein [Methylobacterium brachythecii]GLS44090.1 hypothetical protein GCM10007884_20770 [Methylobacterium brachythecii]
MKRLASLCLMAVALAMPVAAQAGGADGSRQAAGGAFMSTYVNDPYHDPRSLHSQDRGTGQILGAPMYHDGPRAVVSRRNVVDPHWSSGRLSGRAVR